MASKNIVVCYDGTGNEVEGNLSNVLKLFRIAQKNADQRVYYNPGPLALLVARIRGRG
jgi:uncharacterized protein (DUF2235 family)